MEIKALACPPPINLGLPFTRPGREQIAEEVIRRGIVASFSGATVWRWLHADAIRPWCYRSRIWPLDPHFEEKAGRVLNLYHGKWEDEALGLEDYVMCADEKTSIQARKRVIPTASILVHTPIHASWLNQVEIYFLVVQRAVLTPNDFQDFHEVETRLLPFQTYDEEMAKPFEWKFTRENLRRFLAKLSIMNIYIKKCRIKYVTELLT